jgi:alginate O-acetyltransferase complex protein AlgJ
MAQQEAGAPVVPRYTKDNKFVRGKNGRLFLDNDQNDVVLQHTGERLFSPRDLRHWRLLLESRVATLEKLDIPYFHLVPPNAHSVYPEDLPDHVRTHHTRPVLQLIEEIERKGSFAKLIYPLDELIAAKPRLLYPKTDPHWSALGAFIAYERLAEEMSQVVRMHRVREEDVNFYEFGLVGELGFKIEPQVESPDMAAWVRKPTAYLVSDNCVVNTGTIVVAECPEAPWGTCILLGDSFSNWLWLYLAASFRRFVYAYTPTLDYDFIREYEADVVVSVLNERFMIIVPDDFGGPSVRDLEQEKKAHGLLREETPVWLRRPMD